MNLQEYNNCVDLWADKVYRFALKTLKDTDKAKDVVQDTFERLWKNAGKIEEQKAKSYLFTIAYHAMVDQIRGDQRYTELSEPDLKSHAHTVQYNDLNEVLHKAIELLPASQRSVILLSDYEGYSYKEIADITNLNEGQVKSYIFRGRQFLRNYIGKIENIA